MKTSNRVPSLGLLACLVLISLLGCQSKTEAPQRARSMAAPGDLVEEQTRQEMPERRYDGQGKLLASDQYVAGVRLPRGAELFRRQELTHVYRIRAPIDKVLAYFGPMMVTGNVERRGKGALYKRASVRGAEISPTKVDLAILDLGSGMVRISITELPPPPPHAPSVAETKAAAQRDWRTLD